MTDKHGLPEHAKRVFKGLLFEVWQWAQKMYDGTEVVFESVVRDDSATVIATVGEKIVIEDQEQPDWSLLAVSLPGGRCDFDEDPLVCAKRELLEETGYASEEWELWKKHDPAGKVRWTEYIYIARNCALSQAPHLDAGEKIAARLISFDEFLALGENPAFYSRELVVPLVRARYDARAREWLRREIFGK